MKLEFDEETAIQAFREICNSKMKSTLKQDIVDAMRWQFEQDRAAYQRLLDEARRVRDEASALLFAHDLAIRQDYGNINIECLSLALTRFDTFLQSIEGKTELTDGEGR